MSHLLSFYLGGICMMVLASLGNVEKRRSGLFWFSVVAWPVMGLVVAMRGGK